jgi:molecular chaperone DnaK (HSP70)
MRVGIDFGTTRTVVALDDRGNYPLVAFRDGRGSWTEWFPSKIAARDGRLVFGHEAEALAGDPEAWHLASVKRLLARSAPDAPIEVPGLGTLTVVEILSRYLAEVRAALRSVAGAGGAVEATISVPANANGNQRFITLEAFKRAGFDVARMLNEPSAAGVEYAHRFLKKPDVPKSREYIAVYDLGGGTFDAASIRIAGMRHDVVSSEGVEQLGGDDFDVVLMDIVRERLGIAGAGDHLAEAALLAECRERKEALNPNTRRILVEAREFGAGEAVVDAAEYYERCQPLVDRTIQCLDDILERLGEEGEEGATLPKSVATIYVVGGSASFPPVARQLRERYGRRVQRSPYPHGAVAIGLAIAGNPDERFFVRETLTRHFGVWREADSGARVVFDPIFAKDSALENGTELTVSRRYAPAHNVGFYRFLECGALTPDGEPASDVTPWDAIRFAFARELQERGELDAVHVARLGPSPDHLATENYRCDASGIVTVTLRDEATGHEQEFTLSGMLGASPGD